MCGKYNLTKFASFRYYCVTFGDCYHFRLKNGNNFYTQYKNIERQRYISLFYNISRPNFGILLLLKSSFQEFRFFVWICLDQKLIYNANCLLRLSSNLPGNLNLPKLKAGLKYQSFCDHSGNFAYVNFRFCRICKKYLRKLNQCLTLPSKFPQTFLTNPSKLTVEFTCAK